MPKRGVFISLDGIDGTFKTTLAAGLAKHIEANYLEPVVRTKILDDNDPVGRAARKMLFFEPGSHCMANSVANCFFLADHIQRTARVIEPALERGAIIVSDRSVYSNLIYGRAINMSVGMEAAWQHHRGPEPDLLFLLTGDPEAVLARANARTTETHQAGKAWNEAGAQRKMQHAFFYELAGKGAILVSTVGDPADLGLAERLLRMGIIPTTDAFLEERGFGKR